MQTLHRLTTHTIDPLLQCHGLCGEADAVLLMQEGVALLADESALAVLQAFTVPLYVLQADLTARGIADYPDWVTLIDDAEWVKLTVQYQRNIPWD